MHHSKSNCGSHNTTASSVATCWGLFLASVVTYAMQMRAMVMFVFCVVKAGTEVPLVRFAVSTCTGAFAAKMQC